MDVKKTPVTILQELMAKIKSVPLYKFQDVVDNLGLKIFTCEVTCDGITTTGTGKSKKESKQNAACAMLEKIGCRKIMETPNPFYKPQLLHLNQISQDNGFGNKEYILELDRYCVNYNLQNPSYEDLGVLGSELGQKFIMKCIVSNLNVEGYGRTKKQAKNDAAQKMLSELKIFNSEYFMQEKNEKPKLKGILKNSTSDLKSFPTSAVSEFAKLKIDYDLNLRSEQKELVKNLKQADPTILSKLDHTSTIIKECQQNLCEENIKKVKLEFQTLLDLAKLDFHHMLLQTVEPITFMLIIQLNTVPDILEMSLGKTREEAELRTINKVIETLKLIIYHNSM